MLDGPGCRRFRSRSCLTLKERHAPRLGFESCVLGGGVAAMILVCVFCPFSCLSFCSLFRGVCTQHCCEDREDIPTSSPKTNMDWWTAFSFGAAYPSLYLLGDSFGRGHRYVRRIPRCSHDPREIQLQHKQQSCCQS